MTTALTQTIMELVNVCEETTFLISDTDHTVVITSWDDAKETAAVYSFDLKTSKAERFFLGIGGKKQCMKRASRQHQVAVMAAMEKGQQITYSTAQNDNTETLASLVRQGVVRTSSKAR